MKASSYWALKYVLWLALVLAILLLIVLPLAMSLAFTYAPNSSITSLGYLRKIEVVQTLMMQVLTVAWVFYVGSCFASFLNVVAWRVPRGKSILGSSHCPHCNSKLTFKDNIPIFGWLKNQGQCRYCQQPVAKRYFDVEVILGAIFLLVVLITLVSGGINLPLRPVNESGGFERVLFDPKWDLIQIVSFHLVLISCLFTFALIRIDQKPVPVSVFATGIVFGIVMSLVFPTVQLIHWKNPSLVVPGYSTFEINQTITMLLGASCGALCGLVVGRVGWRNLNAGFGAQARCVVFAFVLCGLFLGWQSAISIAVIVVLLEIAHSMVGNVSGYQWLNGPARILVATIIHLVFWKLLAASAGYWPSHASNAVQILGSLLVVFIWAVFLGPKPCFSATDLSSKNTQEF